MTIPVKFKLIQDPGDEKVDLRSETLSAGADQLEPISTEKKPKNKKLGKHQDMHSWAMQQVYNSPPPEGLAPLRWNLDKIKRGCAASIEQTEGRVIMMETMLREKQSAEERELNRKLNRDLEKAKGEIPLNGQIVKLQRSVANLKRLGRMDAAKLAADRLPPLEAKFWGEKLGGDGGHFQMAKRKQRLMRERHALERAQVRGKVRADVTETRRQRDVLLKAQYRANEKSFEDPFSLHYAARFGDMKRLNKLVTLWKEEAHGDAIVVRALAEVRDIDSGRTALHFASRGAQEAVCELLLDLGCDPNALDPAGLTPLHLAAGWGSTRVLGLLLLRGADKEMLDDRGRTAADLARLNDRRAELAFINRWRKVGLTQAEIKTLSELPPLPELQASAKAEDDQELYLQLRNLEMKELTHGSDSSMLASTLGRLASLLRVRNKFDSALECQRRQLAVLEGAGGSDVLVAMNNLSELCFEMGRMGEAEACLTKCLHEALGADLAIQDLDLPSLKRRASENPAVAPALRNLALTLFISERLKEAEPLLRLHLDLEREKHVNEGVGCTSESLGLVKPLEMLGRCCWMCGRYNEALEVYDQAMALVMREKGEASAEVARQFEHIGLVHFLEGNYQKSEAVFKQAHDALLASGVSRFDPETMRICRNVAIAQCKRGPPIF